MSVLKGHPSGAKNIETYSNPATVNPVYKDRFALDTISHTYIKQVGSGTFDAGSDGNHISTNTASYDDGDIIRVTSGALNGIEYVVNESFPRESASKISFRIAQNPMAGMVPADGDSFEIYRHAFPEINSSGEIVVSGTGGSSASPITSVTATVVGVTSTSQTVLSANSSRRYAFLQNDSSEVIYVTFGPTATMNSGIRLNPAGASFLIDSAGLYVGEISAIKDGGGTANLLVQEGQ